MKKNVYIKPTIEVTEFASEVMMVAGSVNGGMNVIDPDKGGSFDSSEDDQYSNHRRGQWGNLWGEK